MIAFLLYITASVLLIVLYKRKIEAHLAFLASVDFDLVEYPTIFDLSKSRKMDHKVIAIKVMLPFFHIKKKQPLTTQQSHLKKKLISALIRLYAAIFLTVVFFELWFRFF